MHLIPLALVLPQCGQSIFSILSSLKIDPTALPSLELTVKDFLLPLEVFIYFTSNRTKIYSRDNCEYFPKDP